MPSLPYPPYNTLQRSDGRNCWCGDDAIAASAPGAAAVPDVGGGSCLACSNGATLVAVRLSDVWTALVKSQALCIFLVAYTLSYAMRLLITQDLLLTKTCLYNLGLEPSLCANFSNYSDTKNAIERVANNYSLFILLVQLTPAALLSIFLGPWCDKYGHKLPIFLATLGGILQDLGTIYTVVNMRAPMYLNVLCSLPNGFSGGLVCVLTAVCSNASLSTSGSMRTLQFLIILMSAMVGLAFGQFMAGQIFRAGGYLPVFIVSASLLLASLAWVVFMLKNPTDAQRNSWQAMLGDLMQPRNFVDGLLVCVRRRPNRGRAQILLLMTSMCTILFVSEGTRGINFFYAKKMYDWDVSKYSDINSGFLLFRMVSVSVFVVGANLVLRLSDCTIAFIGVCCGMLQGISTGVATNEVLFYVSYVLGTLEASAPIGIKSHASKLLNRDETTQVFSVWIAVEALTPIVASVFGSQVYNACISFYPGLPYFVYVLFEIYPLASVVYCWFVYREPMCVCSARPRKDTESMAAVGEDWDCAPMGAAYSSAAVDK
ncbi:proton-coupled folate transporter-like [Dermacentor andersoni]|uniref:proton-coupled folate transporter-like n=1 Tax=Dermacentor andersoni TaxID=34620 RepID=UPI0024176699|nr:proton-coupled folate transporter-like [Dermacentor andersoni]